MVKMMVYDEIYEKNIQTNLLFFGGLAWEPGSRHRARELDIRHRAWVARDLAPGPAAGPDRYKKIACEFLSDFAGCRARKKKSHLQGAKIMKLSGIKYQPEQKKNPT